MASAITMLMEHQFPVAGQGNLPRKDTLPLDDPARPPRHLTADRRFLCTSATAAGISVVALSGVAFSGVAMSCSRVLVARSETRRDETRRDETTRLSLAS